MKKVNIIITDVLDNNECISERLNDEYREVKRFSCKILGSIK